MSKLPALPELGRIVEVTSGRDAGLVCVVVGHEADRFIRIADGETRKVEAPKKKNVAHVKTTPHMAHEVLDELRKHGRVTNAHLRHALRQYHLAREAAEGAFEEGGLPNGEG